MSLSLASDANDEIKMSSKLNAESTGDWACTMANGIKGETVRGGRERRGEEGEMVLPSAAGCARAPLLLVSFSPISSKTSKRKVWSQSVRADTKRDTARYVTSFPFGLKFPFSFFHFILFYIFT